MSGYLYIYNLERIKHALILKDQRCLINCGYITWGAQRVLELKAYISLVIAKLNSSQMYFFRSVTHFILFMKECITMLKNILKRVISLTQIWSGWKSYKYRLHPASTRTIQHTNITHTTHIFSIFSFGESSDLQCFKVACDRNILVIFWQYSSNILTTTKKPKSLFMDCRSSQRFDNQNVSYFSQKIHTIYYFT